MRRRDLMRASALSVAALVIPGAMGSRASGATPDPDATPLAGDAALLTIRWELESITGPDGAVLVPDDPTTHAVRFLDGGQMEAQLDCNVGGATWTLNGSSLAIDNLVSTLIACEPPSIGSDLAAALTEVEAWSITTDAGDHLTLTLSGGGTLEFTPSITGVVWHFTRFQGGDGSEVIPDDPGRYTLEVTGDGGVRVLADCNRGMGTATIDGGGIDLTVAQTRVACPPGSIAPEFTRYLDEAVSWVIRDGQLHLSLPADAGIASFAPVVPAGTEQATPDAG